MPIDVLTNVVTAVGSLALLLNPTPEFRKPGAGITNAPPDMATGADGATAHLLGDWGRFRNVWSDAGFDFTVQYIAEVAGNTSGGIKRGTAYNGLLAVAVDGNFEKLAGWRGGLLHAAMLYPHGRSPSELYVGDLFVLSNIDATDEPRLFEFWFEQSIAGDRLSVRAGQIAADQEFACTERGALFCSSAFGWFPIAGANVPAPVYPQGAPGVRLAWHPHDDFFAQAAVFDGDVNPLNANGRETNPNGVKVCLDEGAFAIFETGYSWERLRDEAKPGSLKVGGWYHTATFDHSRLDEAGLSLADPLSSGNPRRLDGNWGVYLVCEQTLWNKPSEENESGREVGVFSRFGYAPPDRNTLEFYAEAGITCTGLLPVRDEDVCGLGVAYGQMSRELRRLGRDANGFNASNDPIPDHELAIEFDYKCQVMHGWNLQPAVQYIIHPGGSAVLENALVVSLRSTMNF